MVNASLYYSIHIVHYSISGVVMLRVSLNRSAFQLALTRSNLSQKELAHALGVSRTLLSQVIGGKRDPSPMVRKRLLEYFRDQSFDDLFTIDGDGHAG
jgi:transcriptional regulator with XRE-family HTH domain